MRRLIAWSFVAAGLLFVTSALADRKNILMNTTLRAPLRMYVGATPQQFDTIAVSSGQRVEVDNIEWYGDDSAMTSTVCLAFMSLNSRTVYARFADSYTANQIKSTSFQGPFEFPNDSSLLVYYYVQGTTPATLDTFRSHVSYRIDNWR